MIIADTPWYSDERSGLAMLEDRRALIIKRYGFPSDELKSREYLTDQRLKDIERWFGIRWQTHQPYYGMRWKMRPLVARLRANLLRECAVFVSRRDFTRAYPRSSNCSWISIGTLSPLA